jgi:predicted nuclease with TOPRIM domain
MARDLERQDEALEALENSFDALNERVKELEHENNELRYYFTLIGMAEDKVNRSFAETQIALLELERIADLGPEKVSQQEFDQAKRAFVGLRSKSNSDASFICDTFANIGNACRKRLKERGYNVTKKGLVEISAADGAVLPEQPGSEGVGRD